DLVQRGDRHGGQRRVAGEGVGDAGADLDPAGGCGGDGAKAVDLAEEALVGDPEVAEAGTFRIGCDLSDARGRTAPETEHAQPHLTVHRCPRPEPACLWP